MPTETTAPPSRSSSALRVFDVQVYRICEDLTEGLIYFMIVFSPWALGTTQPWSIGVMNACGYAVGALLFVKLALRRWRGYQPNRWGQPHSQTLGPGASIAHSAREAEGRGARRHRSTAAETHAATWLNIALAVLSGLIVVFCFISAANARATFVPGSAVPIYHTRPEWMTRWLPSSMDGNGSWRAFWNYLALTLSFWAIRDWLLGKSDTEIRIERSVEERAQGVVSPVGVNTRHTTRNTDHASPAQNRRRLSFRPPSAGSGFLLPARVRRLLWVISICGGSLAFESIIQRASGSSKLLFLVQPRVNPLGETQFGPYAYRANASQYLNLIWPVTLGFWWTLQRGGGRGICHLLLLACAIMAAGPIISTSRAGAIISVLLLILSIVVLFGWPFIFPEKRRENTGAKMILICGLAAIVLGVALGWKSLAPRLGRIGESFSDREGMYDIARPMARDYPIFGTGPGSYATVFQLYRLTADTYWPAQLHNDWLETRITFGWVGISLIFGAYAVILSRWFVPGGIHGGRRFMTLLWLAMGGCLLHARFDFPFQIYSIVFSFLLLCAVAFDLSHRPGQD